MHWIRSSTHGHGWLSALIIAAAMLVRVAVPAGFMPVTDHGHVTLTICTGHGPVTALLDTGQHHHKPGKDFDHRQDAQHVCPFAAAGQTADRPDSPAPLLSAHLLQATALAAVPSNRIAPPGRSWLRPPLRAPPPSA